MLTVDKIEGKIVRVEEEMKFSELELAFFDSDVKEGDVVVPDGNGRYHTDHEATDRRRKEILDLQNSLWEQE